jgi:glycine cleavage system transcriptional repressor
MDDRTYLTIAALGTDQPGVVRLVSRFVAARGGNVEDSRMVALGGVFGLMLLVSAEPAAAVRIVSDAATLETEAGLRIMIERARDPTSDVVRNQGALWSVTASAVDRAGLLADLAEAVRTTGGNIVELDTTTYRAETGPEPLFELTMTVALRAPGEVGRMKDALMNIAIEERIELAIRPAERAQTKAAGLTLLS